MQKIQQTFINELHFSPELKITFSIKKKSRKTNVYTFASLASLRRVFTLNTDTCSTIKTQIVACPHHFYLCISYFKAFFIVSECDCVPRQLALSSALHVAC